jgi:hypothetical protein
MDNVYAWRLGEAHSIAAESKAGDYIDRGWALAKALHEKGFDIVPRERLSFLDTRATINEMCGLKAEPTAETAT